MILDKSKDYSASSFIQLSNSDDMKEYLLSISMGPYYAELYDLDKINSTFVFSNLFIGKPIISERSVLFKSSLKTDLNNYYIIGFVGGTNKYFYLIKLYLESSNIENETGKAQVIAVKNCTNKYMVSCFETTLFRIICIYQGEEGMMIIIYDLNKDELYSDAYTEPIESNIRIFLKGVLLKEEIGVFMYYTSTTSTTPYISIKQYNNETNKMNDYNSFGQITLTKVEFNSDTSLNDIMKMNDYRICVVSVSPDKIYFIYNIIKFI